MKAIVPAAGKGTRLRPLTDDTPKGLVEVAGRPLLSHVCEALLALGTSEIIIVIGYEGGQIRDAFGEAFRGTPIRYVEQHDQRGLAHAILRGNGHVNGPFLVLNGDNLFETPPAKIRATVHDETADGVLVVERAPPDIVSEGGAVFTEKGEVTKVIEKPDSTTTNLVTTGCYLLPSEFMEVGSTISPSPRGELELADAINALIDRGCRFVPVYYEGWRRNVNSQGDIAAVEERLDPGI